jgi:hypothetical protein
VAPRKPYIVGAFVTGRDHYGREAVIETLLEGGARAHWIVGNRRVGKTSLLRQLELLAARGERLTPLHWDMQGCASYAELGVSLAEAVADHADRCAPLGPPSTFADERDALTLLAHMRRLAARGGRELLLLCDETEALIGICEREPAAMQRLHRALTGGAGVRAVMASTREIYCLYDICRDWPTSPFLGGFDMSITLGSLGPADAKSLILQTQAPRGGRIKAPAAAVAAIRDATNNHPLLLQLLCARLLCDDGTLRVPGDADLRVDSMVASFLEYDFRQLTDADRALLLSIERIHRADPQELERMDFEQPAELKQRVTNLANLGYLRRVKNSYAVGNLFLQAWLSEQAADKRGKRAIKAPALAASPSAMRAVFARQREGEASALALQLNLRRDRLVQLEIARGTELLATPPQVLAEIAQLEMEIRNLRAIWTRGLPDAKPA